MLNDGQVIINRFLAIVPVLYPQKISENIPLFEQVFNKGKDKNNAGLP